MKITNRRSFLIGASTLSLTACFGGRSDYSIIDANANTTRDTLFQNYPDAANAAKAAAGYVVFPNITKAGLFVGASRGEGALYSGTNIIGHYSVTAASLGLQAGLQNFSMILFFMTPDAMANFRSGMGIELGTDVEYALPKFGSLSLGTSSQTYGKPVYALIFNQTGVMAGASLEGAKYSAI